MFSGLFSDFFIVVCGKMYREMTKSTAQFFGILTITTEGLRQTPNGVFGASGALSRADRYFAIFATWLALKDCWEAPPAAKPQNVMGKFWDSACQ